MIGGARWFALGLCVSALGCAFGRVQTADFSDTTKNYRGDDYPATFEAWTRHAKLVQDVGTVMEIWATFKSWDFRQAYVAKYAKAYDLADGERDELAKAQQLVKQVAQGKFKIRVEKLPEVYEMEFFPTRTPFSRTYTLRFVRTEGAGEAFVGPPSGRMILRLASPMGKVEVSWDAKGASQ